jgi:hypothetical protein
MLEELFEEVEQGPQLNIPTSIFAMKQSGHSIRIPKQNLTFR